jgi:3-dehydroquinate synthase
LVAPCVEYKAQVVALDEKDLGERRSLNLGHTTGHVIELATGLSHGESVLYGMLLETKAAIQAGVCDRNYGERLVAVIERALLENPVIKVDFSGFAKVANNALLDKKNAEDGVVTMIVAKNKGKWTTLSLPFEEYVKVVF